MLRVPLQSFHFFLELELFDLELVQRLVVRARTAVLIEYSGFQRCMPALEAYDAGLQAHDTSSAVDQRRLTDTSAGASAGSSVIHWQSYRQLKIGRSRSSMVCTTHVDRP